MEPEVEAALKRKLAAKLAETAAAEAAEAGVDTEALATAPADAVPIAGWAKAAVEATIAIGDAILIYSLLKEVAELERQLQQVQATQTTDVQVKGKRCLVGEYQNIEKICDGQAHHIMPDMVYRLGGRPETAAAESSTANRIPNAPTFNEGMAICLTTTQHSGLHSGLKTVLDGFGAAQKPSGTAPLGKIAPAAAGSIMAIPDLPPECKAIAITAFASQMAVKGLKPSQPGRTQQAPLPSGDAAAVLSRGHY